MERLHEFLKILQRSRGLRTSIRDGGAKVAGLIKARDRAIRTTKVLKGGWAIVTAKVGTKRGTKIVVKVTAIRAVSTDRILALEECYFRGIKTAQLYKKPKQVNQWTPREQLIRELS